eukprot:395227_1
MSSTCFVYICVQHLLAATILFDDMSNFTETGWYKSTTTGAVYQSDCGSRGLHTSTQCALVDGKPGELQLNISIDRLSSIRLHWDLSVDHAPCSAFYSYDDRMAYISMKTYAHGGVYWDQVFSVPNPDNSQSILYVTFRAGRENSFDWAARCRIKDFSMTANSPSPTLSPTIFPSINPIRNPTNYPNIKPTQNPSIIPTILPSLNPSISPSTPSHTPSKNPTMYPTHHPTKYPTPAPTNNTAPAPTNNPISAPTQKTTIAAQTETTDKGPAVDSTITTSNTDPNDPFTHPFYESNLFLELVSISVG